MSASQASLPARKPYMPKEHGIGRIVALAATNALGFLGFSAALLFAWGTLSARSATVLEQSMAPQLAEIYMPMVNPLLGVQSIKLLNSSHIYLMGIIAAALVLLTIVDATLEMCVEYVADRAMISTTLVKQMETGDYDAAITNAGYSTLVKTAGAPTEKKATPPPPKKK